MSDVTDNLDLVRERIEAAARRSGRDADEITLVAVTKTRTVDEMREAIAAGAADFGENYVQEAEAKRREIGPAVRWHMIGHLQRNKAAHAVVIFDLIHGVDSEKLAIEIGRRAEVIGKQQDVLIEVAISGEATKFGVKPEHTRDLADLISGIRGIRLCGLMGMAPFTACPEETRPYFANLKTLWDGLPQEQRLYLSMGMTQDFEIAIEEGANMVRVGTAIFGPRA